jgi:glycosyltransferase involved in cell wall biosynthesis
VSRRTAVAAGLGAAGAAVASFKLVTSRRARHDRVRSNLRQRRIRPTPPGSYRLTVVVPAYRETRIGDTVLRLKHDLEKIHVNGGVEIIVVDDGSHDETAERAELAGADQVIRQPVNRGKGAAIRAGVLAANGRTIAFTDADLSYSPDQIIGLMHQVETGWDVVAGSRRHTDTTTLVKAGRLREIGGRAINLLTRAVLLGEHRDTQCGLKAFRSDVAKLIFTHSHVDGFAFDVEVFHLVERYHLSLTEVPVRVENSSRSTVHVVKDALKLVSDLFRIRGWAAVGVYDLEPGESDLVISLEDEQASFGTGA